MSKILEVIDKLAQQTYMPGWNNPAIKRFIETGDVTLLASIAPFKYSGAWSLANDLPKLNEWTAEAGNVLRLSHAKGLTSVLESWLHRYAKYQSCD